VGMTEREQWRGSGGEKPETMGQMERVLGG